MLTPVQKNLLFTKNDPQDIRLGDLAISNSKENHEFVLIGYPDDEGIKLNGGRIGAAQGPDKIREFLYKMTPPDFTSAKCRLLDLGNLVLSSNLGERHETAKNVTEEHYKAGKKVISFGGGHDYGYSDSAAFCNAFVSNNTKPLIINFDAHLDVRPTTNGFNSGTPFYRLLNEYGTRIDFVEIGIQPQCNSAHHREWAIKSGAEIIPDTSFCNLQDATMFFEKLRARLPKENPVFVSFDIDAITSSEGGGCSQAWVTGLEFKTYLHFFKLLQNHFDIRGLGIYEVSPQLDTDNRTSKMAALATYHFIFGESL